MSYEFFAIDDARRLRDEVLEHVVEEVDHYGLSEIVCADANEGEAEAVGDRDTILAAVRDEIVRRDIRAPQIRRYLPGFRGKMLSRLRSGDFDGVSLLRALQLARAVGLDVGVVVRRR